MFVFDESDVRCVKIVYNNFWVGNVWANIPKDQPRVLEEGHVLVAKTAKGSPTYGWQTMASGLVDAS